MSPGYYMMPLDAAPGGDDSESEPEEANDDSDELEYEIENDARWREYYDDSYDTCSDSDWSDSELENTILLKDDSIMVSSQSKLSLTLVLTFLIPFIRPDKYPT